MDPVTALGVAAAAIQFFDFSRNLLKEYQNQRDGAKALTDGSFKKAANDLISCVKEMRTTDAAIAKTVGSSWSQHEEALRELLTNCQELAQELLDILHILQPKANQGKWSSFCQALSTIRKADYVEELREKIGAYQNQMVIRVLASLNAKMDESLDRQSRHLNILEQKGREISSVLAINHSKTIEAILSLNDGGIRVLPRQRTVGTSFHTNKGPRGSPSFLCLEAPTDDTMSEAIMETRIGLDSEIYRKILDSLHFRYIMDRYDAVGVAHHQTFDWIFCDPAVSDRPWSSFPEWLETGDGCYWIRGKAGSGKSTLMKFIQQNEQTQHYLQTWAGPTSLITASFFFWYHGFVIQKSQEGLLRSLLHQILSSRPWLMARIMPELFIEVTKKGGDFKGSDSLSRSELLRWFKNLGSLLAQDENHKICVFIDGIDEYNGDHTELLELFITLSATTPNLKFVLSSRPTPDCVDALQMFPYLLLEDLTRDDIRTYTADLFRKKAEVALHDNVTELITTEVVSRSSGVFLWVVVVIRSLLLGLRNGDTSEELLQRLHHMPSELGKLYLHILDKIPLEYRGQAAQMLQLLAANFGQRDGVPDGGFFRPFPALQLSYALEDPANVINNPGMHPISEAEAAKRIHQIESRVRSRSLGLVEVKETSDDDRLRRYHVEFIHRTVMEFLNDPEVMLVLESYVAESSVDPYHALFASSVSMVKNTKLEDRAGQLQKGKHIWDISPWQNVWPAIQLARSFDLYGSPISTSYLHELDSALLEHWRLSGWQILKNTNAVDMIKNMQPHNPGHWFKILLRGSSDSLFMTIRSHIQTGTEKIMTQAVQQPKLSTNHSSLSTRTIQESIFRELLRREDELGLYYVGMICPLPTLTEQMPKGEFNTLGKNDLSLLLNLLACHIHPSLYRKDGQRWIQFPEQTTRCYEILLIAGADPNAVLLHRSIARSAWTCFLSVVGLLTKYLWLKMNIEDLKASCQRFERIIKAFISAGADLNTKLDFEGGLLTSREVICEIKQGDHSRESKEIIKNFVNNVLLLMEGGGWLSTGGSAISASHRMSLSNIVQATKDKFFGTISRPVSARIQRRRLPPSKDAAPKT